jgi:hypothetical protein
MVARCSVLMVGSVPQAVVSIAAAAANVAAAGAEDAANAPPTPPPVVGRSAALIAQSHFLGPYPSRPLPGVHGLRGVTAHPRWRCPRRVVYSPGPLRCSRRPQPASCPEASPPPALPTSARRSPAAFHTHGGRPVAAPHPQIMGLWCAAARLGGTPGGVAADAEAAANVAAASAKSTATASPTPLPATGTSDAPIASAHIVSLPPPGPSPGPHGRRFGSRLTPAAPLHNSGLLSCSRRPCSGLHPVKKPAPMQKNRCRAPRPRAQPPAASRTHGRCPVAAP